MQDDKASLEQRVAALERQADALVGQNKALAALVLARYTLPFDPECRKILGWNADLQLWERGCARHGRDILFSQLPADPNTPEAEAVLQVFAALSQG